jgi:rhamnulokinase
MVGTVAPGGLALEEAHRFPNAPVEAADGSLHWDLDRIYAEVIDGLRKAGPVDSIGVDSWAVDYGLLDSSGALLGAPYSYRDARTKGAQAQVLSKVTEEELYAVTGLQQLPFNTIYQLASEPTLSQAATILLIPDLIAYWLTGVVGAEATNASTTQLYDVRRRSWATDLAARVGVPERLLPPLREPGSVIGELLPEVAASIGQTARTPVIAVGSHDTASAVVAVPAAPGSAFAYVSSGTWSLVGLELSTPVLTEAARSANFTNEGGVDRTVRFLHNVMGLWVLSETMKTWQAEDLTTLLASASTAPEGGAVVDIDAPEFLPPGDMEARIMAACQRTGQQSPATRAEVVRCILESLALATRRAVRTAAELSGRAVDVVHVVGGGARNTLLCQLTADACGLPVLAGPVEATALGSVLVQARTLGADLPHLDDMRAMIRDSYSIVRYDPAGDMSRWDAAESILRTQASAR